MEPRGIDEPNLVERLGMRCLPVPVGPTTMTDITLDLFREGLISLDATVKFVHCATAVRVAAVMIPHLTLD